MNPNFRILIIVAAIALLSSPCFSAEYREVEPGRRLTFPNALYFDPAYKVQWWYVTGHLTDGDGNEFGYELTFFAAGVQQKKFQSRFGVNTILISHFAISDIQGKRFLFSEKTDSGAYGFAGAETSKLRVWVDQDELSGDMKKLHLSAADAEKELRLTLVPTKPVVLHGNAGYSRKSEESALNASYYFSYTSLATEGTLRIGDRERRVSGKSWFDRELSTRGLGKNETGWDWFALQFEDGRELMLYQIRNAEGSPGSYSSGTVVSPDGGARHLRKEDFSITVLDSYRSRKTGSRYPSQWEVRVPSEALAVRVVPLLRDQEVVASSTRNHYWEGACRVSGSASGRAYVEMTGY